MKADPASQRRLLELQTVDTAIAHLEQRVQALPVRKTLAELAERRKTSQDELVAAETELSDAELARAKAEAEYKAAMVSWRVQMTMAVANAAQAILQQLAGNLGPAAWVQAALAATMGAFNVAAIAKAEPQPPSFSTGGIVPGSQYSGDRVSIQANSGEGVFTQDQMAHLAPVGEGERKIYLTIIQQYDSIEVARSCAEVYNDGVVEIKARGIRGR